MATDRPHRLLLHLGLIALCAGCASTSAAEERLSQGDWAGAKNLLTESMKGERGSDRQRALLLFTHAGPDALDALGEGWLLRACALDEQAAPYVLQASPSESDTIQRARNDMRRSLNDKGVVTEDAADYGVALRETVRYALEEYSWEADELAGEATFGLCGLWLDLPGAADALIAPLASTQASARGAERLILLAGDRALAPLQAIADDPAHLASGPASDALRTLKRDQALTGALQLVSDPWSPEQAVRSRMEGERVKAPPVSGARLPSSRRGASDEVRRWFRLSPQDSGPATTGWAWSALRLDSQDIELLWTVDSKSNEAVLQGLTWDGRDWVSLRFDGRSDLRVPEAVITGVGPTASDEEGDLFVRVFKGVGEETYYKETWAGPQAQTRTAALVERQVWQLDGVAARRVEAPEEAE